MLIYDALKKDHEKVKQLMSELVSLSEKDFDKKEALIKTIRDELVPHSRAEEAVFYNPLRELDGGASTLMHAYAEHLEAEVLLRTLQVAEKINIGWQATAKKLQAALDHHVHEEETKVFGLAKKVLTDSEAEMMANAFEKMKPEIREEGFLQTSFDMIANLMPVRLSKFFKMPKTDDQDKRQGA